MGIYRKYSTSVLDKIKKLNSIIRGWVNYFRIADMEWTLKSIDSHLRFRLRMIIWKQWKTPKNRIKQLRKCGFPDWMAKAYGNSRKGIARCASSFMKRAIPTKTLKESGLLSLVDHYNSVHNF